MKIRYDSEVDALYIRFKTGPVEVETIQLNEDVAVNIGPNEEIVGIEVLDASKNAGLTKMRPTVKIENLDAVKSGRQRRGLKLEA